MTTAALLLGAAVAVLLWRPATRLSAEVSAPSRLPLLAAAAAGLAVWAFVGGVTGLLLGTGALVAVPRLLARLDDDEPDDEAVASDLPLALDLLAACLAGGAAPADAVAAVGQAFAGPCGARFARVASALRLGAAPADAWAALGTQRDAAGAAARSLARAAEGGAPVAETVRQVAAEARRERSAERHRRAAQVGVWAVLPLGVCFLPAFVLIGVVPAVVGLAGPVLHGLG